MNNVEMITDEELDRLGDRFLCQGVREYTGIPFWRYLTNPDGFDGVTAHLKAGGSVVRRSNMLVMVETGLKPVSTVNRKLILRRKR